MSLNEKLKAWFLSVVVAVGKNERPWSAEGAPCGWDHCGVAKGVLVVTFGSVFILGLENIGLNDGSTVPP